MSGGHYVVHVLSQKPVVDTPSGSSVLHVGRARNRFVHNSWLNIDMRCPATQPYFRARLDGFGAGKAVRITSAGSFNAHLQDWGWELSLHARFATPKTARGWFRAEPTTDVTCQVTVVRFVARWTASGWTV